MLSHALGLGLLCSSGIQEQLTPVDALPAQTGSLRGNGCGFPVQVLVAEQGRVQQAAAAGPGQDLLVPHHLRQHGHHRRVQEKHLHVQQVPSGLCQLQYTPCLELDFLEGQGLEAGWWWWGVRRRGEGWAYLGWPVGTTDISLLYVSPSLSWVSAKKVTQTFICTCVCVRMCVCARVCACMHAINTIHIHCISCVCVAYEHALCLVCCVYVSFM